MLPIQNLCEFSQNKPKILGLKKFKLKELRVMFDILKKLKKSIKILMLVLAILIIVCIIGILTGAYPLSVVCAVGFIVVAIIIAIIYSRQESSTVFKEDKFIKKISEYIKTCDSITYKELATQFKITESQTRHIVFESFKANLIEGYVMNGNKIEKAELTDSDKNNKVVKCSGCGARFASNTTIKKCPYCGNLYE